MSSKRKRIYLSVLGVGLCVVVYDVVTRDSGPAEAMASSAADASQTETSKSDAPKQGIAALSIQPFPQFAESTDLSLVHRDIFAPSEEVIRRLSGPEAESDDGRKSEDNAGPPPVPFNVEHTLSAIIELQGTRSAVVDGVIFRKGQRLADCAVVEIAQRSVRFECPSGIEVLELVDPIIGERPVE